VAFGANVHSKG